MPHVWALGRRKRQGPRLYEKAIAIDPQYPLALSLAGVPRQSSVYNWADDTRESAMARRAQRGSRDDGDDLLLWLYSGAVQTCPQPWNRRVL